MKELIHLHNAACRWEGHALTGYSSNVFAGEIACVVGISGSGKIAIEKLLTGQAKLSSGALFIHGERLHAYGPGHAFEMGIYSIGTVDPMVPNLTIADNLEAIRYTRTPFRIYDREKADWAASRILTEYKIGKDPGTHISELSFLEKQVLSIAKVVSNCARLVMINCVYNTYSAQDAIELGKMMRRLTKTGVSFLIISERPNPFFDVADKVQIIHKGQDQYQWEVGTFELQSLYRIWEQSSVAKAANAGSNPISALYLLDFYWSSHESMVTYLQALRNHNPEIWREHIHLEIPESDGSADGKTVIIPYNSADKLMNNLSLGDNLIICIPRRVGAFGIQVIHAGMRQVLVREFCQFIGVTNTSIQIHQLTGAQRKILSIHRWVLAHPETIVLENPYWGMDAQEIEQVNAYLSIVAHKRIRLIFYVKQSEDIMDGDATVISTYAGKNAKML